MNRSIKKLRKHARFDTAADAVAVAQSMWRMRQRGHAVVVLLDRGRRVVDLFNVEDGGDQLVEIISLLCEHRPEQVESLFVVVDRTGEVPADRPDDELVWLELSALTAAAGMTLLDWLVVWDHYAFSVAEHAPEPARW